MNVLAFFVADTPSLVILALFALVFPVLALYCLVDIVRADFKEPTGKLMWVLIVLFAPFLGSILYLVMRRKSKV